MPLLVLAAAFYLTAPLFPYPTVLAQTPPVSGENIAATPAVNNPQTQVNGKSKRCVNYPEAKGGVLLGIIVPCVLHTVEDSANDLSRKIISWLMPTVYSFIVLAVSLFGVKVTMGERNIQSQAILLLLKIGFVLAVLQMIPNDTTTNPATPGLIDTVYDVMNEGVSMTTTALSVGQASAGNPSGIHCEIDQYGDANTPLIWKQMDCVLGKLYGFATGKNVGPGNTKPVNMLLASSVVGLLSGFLFGGTFGVAVFLALVGVLWSVLHLILRVTMAYLNGYLVICVVVLLAPLFLPLVLLKITTDFFERWWKAILASILLPVIISAYSMFALLAYDQLLFAPDSKLQKLFDQDAIKSAQQLPKKLCDMHVTNDPSFQQEVGVSMDDLIKGNPLMQQFGTLLSGSNDPCGAINAPNFDVTQIKDGTNDFKDKQNALFLIFKDALKLFVMAFLIEAGLDAIEGAVNSFTGSRVAFAAMNARSQTEQKLIGNFQGARKAAEDAFSVEGSPGGASGAEFIKRLPGAALSSSKELFEGMMRK
jgi:type IV secretory pathway VirB6-like protein